MKPLVVLIIALLISSSAIAEGECQGDREKFCKDMAKSEVGACLDKHTAELSESCKVLREAHAKKNAEESAKMGKEEGSHKEPGPGATPESDTSKIDQPARQNPTTSNEPSKQ
jgi:hypothetical protein